ncbi:hypothetical protein M9Y10_007143 [Tritrichomonas musculus]|uniref:DUF3447 domain-containing protein n=1 Tax=Tritrichomonas musculus TaxID=1915356 RepID=A0ABR2J2G5_9EUKA
MSVAEYLNSMKEIQELLLQYIEDTEEYYLPNFERLKFLFDELKIHEDQIQLKSILHLILFISNNHNRPPKFFPRIEQILSLFTKEMKEYFTNLEIFDIFKSNKPILLFLIKNQILTIDQQLADLLIGDKFIELKYSEFFAPEIEPFFGQQEQTDNFEEKRKIGENDSHICEMIRNDSINEFITFTSRSNYRLSSKIPESNFETNPFLLKQENTTLIEYAAFFGSIQVFNYLKMNKVPLKPSLWIYAIHSNNPDMIHLLDQNKVRPLNDKFDECLKEAIKCHHNDIVNYIRDNLLDENYIKEPKKVKKNQNESNDLFEEEEEEFIEDKNDSLFIKESLKYYNFHCIQENSINESSFYDLCRYDHYEFVQFLLNIPGFNPNIILILKYYFFSFSF